MFPIIECTVHAVTLLVHLSLFQLHLIQLIFKLVTVDGLVIVLLVVILAGEHIDEFPCSLVLCEFLRKLIVFVAILLVFKLNSLQVMLKLRRDK